MRTISVHTKEVGRLPGGRRLLWDVVRGLGGLSFGVMAGHLNGALGTGSASALANSLLSSLTFDGPRKGLQGYPITGVIQSKHGVDYDESPVLEDDSMIEFRVLLSIYKYI